MALMTPIPSSVVTAQLNLLGGMSVVPGVGTKAAASHPSDDQADWKFQGPLPADRLPRLVSAPEWFSGSPYDTSLGAMTMQALNLNSAFNFSRSRQPMRTVTAEWPAPPPEERRLQNAIELDRAEIGFDETAAGILGRFYDLGHASTTDLADWFQSAEQWIAFSRLQRCRFVEDLGSLFTLSREGRQFVEEMLAEDPPE